MKATVDIPTPLFRKAKSRAAERALARLDIVDWIHGFYNHRRLHSMIGYQTPAHVESSLMAA